MRFNLRMFLILLASITLLACNDSETVENNLSVNAVSVDHSHVLQYQETFTLNYTVETSGFENIDVDIHFYLIHENELTEETESEQNVDDVRQLGAAELFDLSHGVSEHQIEVTVPLGVTGGHYRILALIDPHNDHEEDNENDNHPSTEHQPYADGDFPFAKVEIYVPSEHDYQLSKVELGHSELVLDVPHPEKHEDHHHSEIIGYIDAIYEGNNNAAAYLKGEVEIAGNWYPVVFWDAIESQYLSTMNLLFNAPHQSNHFGFDIDLSDEQIALLYQNYDDAAENQVNFRLTVEDALVHDETHDHNNQIEFSLPLYFFHGGEQTVPSGRSNQVAKSAANVKLEKEYSKYYGDKSKFSVGVDLYGKLLLVPVVDPGARIVGEANVDAYFFNAQNTLFGISYDGSAYVSGVNTGYASEMTIFNNVVFEDEKYALKFEKTLEKSWEEEKVLASARFTIGPVPIKIEAGVTGNLGFEFTVGYNAELYAGGDLFHVDFGAFGRGGVDLALVSAGVQAVLTLIDNTFALDSSAGFSLASNTNNNPHIYYSMELTNDLDVISGKFGLYAEVIGVKWCKKWGIPYPCGKKTTKYDLWLYQTKSVFSKVWTLFEKEGEVSL